MESRKFRPDVRTVVWPEANTPAVIAQTGGVELSSGQGVPPMSGRLVRLEPLEERHIDGLVAAAAGERSTFDFTTVPDGRSEMAAYVRELLGQRDAGTAVPFAQVSVADEVVLGATRYLNFHRRAGETLPFGVEIGGTWLAGRAQRTGANTDAKLSLLRHAFDAWRVARVDFKTDTRNERSRTAIARVGATFEGVLRKWQPSHALGEADTLRDTAVYSIISVEWPTIRTALEERRQSC